MQEELVYAPRSIRSPNAIIHLEYDPNSPPPKPSGDWTRFVCISDTHSHTFPVPDGDVLLHSGDLTNSGTKENFVITVDWLKQLKHKKKMQSLFRIIAGNHDLTLHEGWYELNFYRWHRNGMEKREPILQLLKGPEAIKAGIVYLQDEHYEFQTKENGRTWSVYGSPWSPEFYNWAFNYDRENGDELVAKFPKTDILLTHGPAFGIFDETRSGEEVGCESLRYRLQELRPRLHLAGHIHEARGAHIHTWSPEESFAAPLVQNSDRFEDDENSENVSEEDNSKERTAFVNAANWPMGKLAFRDGRKTPFGGPGFQPIIVDLID